MARALALQGAEVLIHPTAEPWSDVDQEWDLFRRVRACENWAYLASVAAGAFVGSDRPKDGYRGHSQVIDFHGNVEWNYLAQLRSDLYAEVYKRLTGGPVTFGQIV
jgi:predicted amidohydrolase